MSTSSVKTTCPYCGVGCGVIATHEEHGEITIKGDPDHPANWGRLCSKGAALAETLDLEGRLLHPTIHGKRTDWSTALQTVATKLNGVIEQHGPDAIALYVSGQLLTEDYYVANKWMKGFVGSANIDTNSRLCMSSAVAAHKRAFGSDIVPCNYEDIESAELITIVGSNTAWCHPVLYQRIVKAKKKNPTLKVVVIDPRNTATTELADLHLDLTAGSDGFLFSGLLRYLHQQQCVDSRFLAEHCEGVEETLLQAMRSTPDTTSVANACKLPLQKIERFYHWFSSTEKSLTLFSQGVNQSTSGTDKGNAIINCHLLTGRIGKAGMGPFSITGQPNAMGGREVGGLANQLAAHMEIENQTHHTLVKNFWKSDHLCQKSGLKATEMVEAIEQGTIKAIWIIATNPAVSLPDSNRVKAALEQCDLVIVSDCVTENDTLRYADIQLPALAWGEKDGSVTNSERRISRQRPFLPPPGEARADWEILCEVAQRMGYHEGFNFKNSAAIFREHAALTTFHNDGSRDLYLGPLATISKEAYEALSPLQWPLHTRPFSDGKFFTPNQKAQLIPITPQHPALPDDSDYPVLLNSGRSRDQWHTMTRSGKSPRLANHNTEPYLELSPEDAKQHQIVDGSLVSVTNPIGSTTLRATIKSSQRGTVFAPIHWSESNSSGGTINRHVSTQVDPFSGQPAFKQNRVALAPFPARWHGFILSRRPLSLTACGYWSRSRGKEIWRYTIAGEATPESWASLARQWICADQADVGWVEYFDPAQQQYRAARSVEDAIDSCIYIGPDETLPSYEWIEPLFLQSSIEPALRTALLSGKPPVAVEDQGKVVCACFGVRSKEIQNLIETEQISTTEEITQQLKAGGNCGSCLPEMRQLLSSC